MLHYSGFGTYFAIAQSRVEWLGRRSVCAPLAGVPVCALSRPIFSLPLPALGAALLNTFLFFHFEHYPDPS